MNVTDVTIKLVNGHTGIHADLKAYCSVTLDGEFVVRDIKVLSSGGNLFIGMPSRKLHTRCHECSSKVYLKAWYCSYCGARLGKSTIPLDAYGREKLHAGVAHPVTSECREHIERYVLAAYYHEVERSKRPGYVSSYDMLIEDVAARYQEVA